MDYQWPTPILSDIQDFDNKFTSKQEIAYLYQELNDAFSHWFKVPAFLLPSARSAIASILEFERITRGDIVFVPHYSSQCLWDTLGRFASPTITDCNNITVTLAVHKYGYVHRNPPASRWLIEDSVDSIVTQPESLFPLGGKYEVFSLPKIMRTWSGGVVVTRSAEFLDWAQQFIVMDNPLAQFQAHSKYLYAKKSLPEFQHPYFLEPQNRTLERNGLMDIKKQLKKLPYYAERIRERAHKVEKKMGHMFIIKEDRLPPVIPFNKKHFSVKHPEKWIVRYMNASLGFSIEDYEPHYILPIHDAVTDEMFQDLLSDII